MPKAVLYKGEIVIAKTRTDVESEFRDRVEAAFKRYQESMILHAEFPEKIKDRREDYKKILLERDAEIIKYEKIIFNK